MELIQFGSRTEIFDVLNICASLRINGQLRYVTVSRRFSKDDLEHVEKWTGIDASSHNLSWRAVHLPEDEMRNTAVGWASVEHPELKSQLVALEDLMLPALSISTGKLPGFFHLGSKSDVYNVLFLRKIDGERYQRVGMGKLFEKNFFTRVKAQELVLL